jgi:hypothetical protein
MVHLASSPPWLEAVEVPAKGPVRSQIYRCSGRHGRLASPFEC